MSELYEYTYCRWCGKRTSHEDYICEECGHCRLSKKRMVYGIEKNTRTAGNAEKCHGHR